MDKELADLVIKLRGLSGDARSEVLTAVLGAELLPEVEQDQGVRYRAQGIDVDQELFEFLRETTGIFPIQESMVLPPDEALSALEAAQRNRYVEQNLKRYMNQSQSNREEQLLFALRDHLGIKTQYPWQVPPLHDFQAAIAALSGAPDLPTPETQPTISNAELLKLLQQRLSADPTLLDSLLPDMGSFGGPPLPPNL